MDKRKKTIRLEYEAYEPMAVQMLAQIGAEIEEKWRGASAAITHRIGVLDIGEAAVVIAVSSPIEKLLMKPMSMQSNALNK